MGETLGRSMKHRNSCRADAGYPVGTSTVKHATELDIDLRTR